MKEGSVVFFWLWVGVEVYERRYCYILCVCVGGVKGQ